MIDVVIGVVIEVVIDITKMLRRDPGHGIILLDII